MSGEQPLSREAIQTLVKRDSKGHVVRRESSSLEFKESFSWGGRAKYAKSIAAFANAKGGYLVFGVKNKPRELVGLKSDSFDRLDEADMTQFLNEYLEPEVRIERRSYRVAGTDIGIIYVYEAETKPVICAKNSGEDLKEGEIYYRYRGASKRIRYTELRAILAKEAQRLHDRLLETIIRVGKIGVGNVVLFDTQAGQIHAGGSVIVDRRLLDEVKFILEGKFHEIDGDPTLRLIGDAVPAQVVTHQKAVALRASQMLNAFFGHGLPEGAQAQDVIEQLPYESSSFLPVFFFAREAGLTNEQAAGIVERSQATGATKGRVLSHLRSGFNCADKGTLQRGTSEHSDRRADLYELLAVGGLDPERVTDADLKLALEAVTHLAREQLEALEESVLLALEKWHERSLAAGLRQQYGTAVCHVDEALFRA